MCQTSPNRQKPFGYWLPGGCEATERTSVHTQVVRISIKTCDMTTAALSISKMWWRDYGNASQKGSLVNSPFLLIPCAEGLVGSWWRSPAWRFETPLLLKEMSWITFFFNHYLRRTKKKVVEAIHVSLVVSVQWRGRGVRLDWVG